ncbi:FUSC family protein [Streptomyces sp. NPDC057445]|uniref:FUSC family protein n=1 Tax=Streptomyces sp. NPDC057445 TaxID=3346136 RepID=UPI003685CE06
MKTGPERTAILRRAVRVTVATSTGFYIFLYGFHEPTLALYALFAPVAMGVLSSIPGSGRQRAVVMLKALPVALLLVTLGTALAISTWAAVLGMLVVAFLLVFAAVAGPRPAGAAPGLQLFYILACFPPYAPDTLGMRLTGLTVGVLLLAACEVFLLPAPAPVSYRIRLAEALVLAAGAADRPAGASPDQLRATGDGLRFSRLPPAERPAGPGRRDRALAQAGSATRRLLDQLAHLEETSALAPRPGTATSAGRTGQPGTASAATPTGRPGTAAPATSATSATSTGNPATTSAAHPEPVAVPGESGTGESGTGEGGAELAFSACDALLRRVAVLCRATAVALRDDRPPPRPGELQEAIHDFQQLRIGQAKGPPDAVPPVPVLRRQAAVVAVAESARIVETALRVASDGIRTAPIPPRELFWYAETSTPRLWLKRLTGNMTLHSVQFQNAVRTALGLGAARLVAGSLDLAHGFWVLLVVLTLGRTTAGETWAAVRQALAGNLVGAVAAGALLVAFGEHTDAYAAVLVPGMLAAFALGPLLGIAWAQALFTLVVATAFAQIAPASWHLAEQRLVDVVTGSAVGLLCGLLAWPAGARHEVRRTMAGLIRSCGPLITGTVATLLATPPGARPPPSTLPTLSRLQLAESAYAQYRSEPTGIGSRGLVDWHALLIATNQILLGALWLPRIDLPVATVPAGAADWARTTAAGLAATADRIAALATEDSRQPRAPDPPPPVPADAPPLPVLIDLEVWLRGLDRQFAHIEASVREIARPVPGPDGHGS